MPASRRTPRRHLRSAGNHGRRRSPSPPAPRPPRHLLHVSPLPAKVDAPRPRPRGPHRRTAVQDEAAAGAAASPTRGLRRASLPSTTPHVIAGQRTPFSAIVYRRPRNRPCRSRAAASSPASPSRSRPTNPAALRRRRSEGSRRQHRRRVSRNAGIHKPDFETTLPMNDCLSVACAKRTRTGCSRVSHHAEFVTPTGGEIALAGESPLHRREAATAADRHPASKREACLPEAGAPARTLTFVERW